MRVSVNRDKTGKRLWDPAGDTRSAAMR